MAKSGRSSKKLAKVASRALRRKNSSRTTKRLAGSVLSQAPNRRRRTKKK